MQTLLRVVAFGLALGGGAGCVGSMESSSPGDRDAGEVTIDGDRKGPDAGPIPMPDIPMPDAAAMMPMMPDAGPPVSVCRVAVEGCTDTSECCGDLVCGHTTAGQVCCGNVGETCATVGGEDCCGDLLCRSGQCVSPSAPPAECGSSCIAAPALATERTRLSAIGGSFLGICGDAAHTYGYHVPAARLPASDYSMRGAANVPVCAWHACAIDIGMDWPASRSWLRWLIAAIREDRIRGIAEVIGSYDGVNVRYWSDSSGWGTDGMRYTGSGHDSWTHVSIYRSTALDDHGILAGWSATGGP